MQEVWGLETTTKAVGDETGVDEPGTMSPILGFPSLFDLPASPVLCFSELPVSWFTSPENSREDPRPAPAPPTAVSAPTAISAPTTASAPAAVNAPTAAAAPAAEVTSGLKRKQPLVADEVVAAPEKGGEQGLSTNKRPRRSTSQGADVRSAATGMQAQERNATTGEGAARMRDVASVAVKKSATVKKGVSVKKGTAVKKGAAAKKGVVARDGPDIRTEQHSPSSSATVDPPWLTSALSMLESEELSGWWKSLVQVWADFERKEGNQASSVLGSAHRPAVVRDWIQRARSTLYRPTIKSTSDFQVAFMKWWEGLQPDWRLSTSGEIIASNLKGDWGGLRRAGRNGLLSVIAALFFWGFSLKKVTNADWAGWNMASDDCLRVLNALIE